MRARSFALLLARLHARRVAQCYLGAGRTVPPLTARILADDTEERIEEDCTAFAAWCAARGVECVRVLGITSSSFAQLPSPLGDTLNRAVITIAQATIYLNAANRSFDRYQAALLASDNIHASFQLEAVLYYLSLYRKSAEDASPALNGFESVLTSVLGQNWSPALSQLKALQLQWAANGVPSGVRTRLASLGLSDADINAIATDFESANLSPPQGQSIFTQTSDLVSALPLLVSHASTISTLLSEIKIALQEGNIDNQGVAASLTAELQAAQSAKQQQTAKQQINAFMNDVSAQSGKHIDRATADLLIADAQNLFAQ
jgi:hypothetical protein